jgi:hypothetical protein
MEAEAGTNSTRRAAAIGVILLGGVALWWLGGSGADITSAKNTMARSIAAGQKRTGASDPRLAGAHRFEEGGWIYVHLEGDAAAVGFQHGYLLGPEIEDAFTAISAGMTHDTRRDMKAGPWTEFHSGETAVAQKAAVSCAKVARQPAEMRRSNTLRFDRKCVYALRPTCGLCEMRNH